MLRSIVQTRTKKGSQEWFLRINSRAIFVSCGCHFLYWKTLWNFPLACYFLELLKNLHYFCCFFRHLEVLWDHTSKLTLKLLSNIWWEYLIENVKAFITRLLILWMHYLKLPNLLARKAQKWDWVIHVLLWNFGNYGELVWHIVS